MEQCSFCSTAAVYNCNCTSLPLCKLCSSNHLLNYFSNSAPGTIKCFLIPISTKKTNETFIEPPEDDSSLDRFSMMKFNIENPQQGQKQLEENFDFYIEGHSDWVSSVVISSDNKLAISASWDKTVRVWDIEQKKQIFVMKQSLSEINTLCLSNDMKFLFTGHEDNTAQLWSFPEKRPLTVFTGHSRPVLCVAISSDNSFALSGSEDRTVRMWNLKTFQQDTVFSGHRHYILCFCNFDMMRYMVFVFNKG